MSYRHFFVPFRLIGVLVVITGILFADPPVVNADTVHILPLGDSITQGGRKDRKEYSFRYPLFYLLKDAKYDFDFVGSLTTGLNPEFTWPDKGGIPFDPHHEGHYGVPTEWLRDRLREFMKSWSAAPDIVIINSSGNDMGAKYFHKDGTPTENFDKDVVQPYRDMIAMLREKNPHVVVLIGKLQWKGGPAGKINSEMELLARTLGTGDSPIAAVDDFKGWGVAPDGGEEPDTFDGAHPNEKGQAKLAANWFEALKPYLAKRATAKTDGGK
jgi:lysophospholipase L1-like esterase